MWTSGGVRRGAPLWTQSRAVIPLGWTVERQAGPAPAPAPLCSPRTLQPGPEPEGPVGPRSASGGGVPIPPPHPALAHGPTVESGAFVFTPRGGRRGGPPRQGPEGGQRALVLLAQHPPPGSTKGWGRGGWGSRTRARQVRMLQPVSSEAAGAERPLTHGPRAWSTGRGRSAPRPRRPGFYPPTPQHTHRGPQLPWPQRAELA